MAKSSKINVILKTPAQKTEDQTIKCDLDWTVSKLKIYISENYPLKPSVNDQRLIYSGHLLKDNKTLKEIFQPSEEENLTFTVHLVLNQKDLKENKKDNLSSNNNETNASLTNQSVPNLSNFTQFSFNLTNDSSVDLTNFYRQQMQQYQEMYVNYMAQYLNSNNNNNSDNNFIQQPATIIPFMINPLSLNPFLMPNLINLNPINSTTNDNTNQTANETEIVNENQDANDDLDLQNNWLDIFWNLLILFSLASASLSRTLFVLVVSFIYYLYKAGFFSFIRIRLVNLSRQNNNQNRNEEQLQQMMDNNLDAPGLRNRRSDNEQDTDNENNNQQQSYLLDKFRFIFMIISSLFSSLMPNDINLPAN